MRGLTLCNTRVIWSDRLEDYYGAALEARHVEGLQLENFAGQAAWPGKGPDNITE